MEAYELAGITYRQLDHWARQGWVRPSVHTGRSRSGRRLYLPSDVIRLNLLRHLARSKVNTTLAGEAVVDFSVPDDESLVVWGPTGVSVSDDEIGLRVVAADRLLEVVEQAGGWVVYNPAALRRRLDRARPALRGQVATGLARRIA